MTDASGNLPQVGVQLVAAGSEAYRRAMEDANKATASFGRVLKDTQPAVNGAMAAAMAFGNVVGTYAVRALDQAARFAKAFTTEAVNVAARFQQLQQVAYLQGQQQGKSAADMDAIIAKIRSYGIEAAVAADQVIQFTRYELDLGKATDLARVAQDAAVLTGSNSSETLSRLMWGIQTYNTEVFRTVGLTVRIDDAMQAYAKSVNKTTEQLTNAERSQAVMNAVLEEGRKIEGAYLTSLETPAKILSSLPRILNDIQVAIGTPFLAGLANFAKTLYEGGKAVTQLFAEGGKLYPLLVQLGAVFNAFGQIFRETFSPQAIEQIGSWLANVLQQFISFATPMVEYGLNIIAQFSAGIIEGISAFLVPAINAVASILSWLMAPGSPPRFLPDIDQWGAGAMNAYLHGMTEADFDVLSSMQGIFQSALSGLGIEKPEALFRELSRAAMEALSGGTNTAFLNQIRSVLGEYGNEVAELVELQLQLASANEKVQKAEEALKKSRKEETTAQKNLTKIIEDYNRLASEGASKPVLDAKRREYEAAKAARDTASKARKEAENNIETMGDEREELSKKVALQKSLVEQMIKLTAVQKEAKTGGLGAGVGAAKPNLSGLKVDPPKVDSTLTELTKRIRDKLAAAFAPLTNLWNDPDGPIARLREAFERIGQTLNKIDFKPINDFFNNLKSSGAVEMIGRIVADFLIFQGIVSVGGPLLKGFGTFLTILASGGGAMTALKMALAAILTSLSGLVKLAGGPLGLLALAIIGVAEAWNQFVTKTNEKGVADVDSATASLFAQTKKAAKGDPAAMLAEYKAMNERIQASYANSDLGGKIAQVFVDKNGIATQSLKNFAQSLMSLNLPFREYQRLVVEAAKNTGDFANGQFWAALQSDATDTNWAYQQLAYSGIQVDEATYNLQRDMALAHQTMNDGLAPTAAYGAVVAGVGASAKATEGDVRNMVTQIQDLITKQGDLEKQQKTWLEQTAGKVETMLGTSLPVSSEAYAKALAVVDQVFGTMKVKEKETSDAFSNAVAQYAKTGDLETFKSALTKLKDDGLAPLKEEIQKTDEKLSELKLKLEQMPAEIRSKVYVDIQYPEMPEWLKKLLNGTLIPPEPEKKYSWEYLNPDGTPKAAGGAVSAGEAYLVGERGRELFVPDMSGQILSNGVLEDLFTSINAGVAMLFRAQRVAQLAKAAILPAFMGNSSATNYNLTLQTRMSASTVRQGFELMRVLGG